MSNARMLAKLFRLALGLPTDPDKTYGFRPGTGWVESTSGGGGADVTQRLIDGGWRYTTVEQDLTAGYELAVFAALPVTTAITAAYAGSMGEGAGWAVVASAGGGVTRPQANTPSVVLNTGTTATGTCRLSYSPSPIIWDNDHSETPSTYPRDALKAFSSRVALLVPSLSTAAQEYVAQVDMGPEGWMFDTPAPASRGVIQLVYKRTESLNWRVRYCDTSGAVKFLDTGVRVESGYVMRASVRGVQEPDGTFSITVKIDTTVATITDSYLNTGAWKSGYPIERVLWVPSVGILKLIGTTTATLQVRLFAFAYSH